MMAMMRPSNKAIDECSGCGGGGDDDCGADMHALAKPQQITSSSVFSGSIGSKPAPSPSSSSPSPTVPSTWSLFCSSPPPPSSSSRSINPPPPPLLPPRPDIALCLRRIEKAEAAGGNVGNSGNSGSSAWGRDAPCGRGWRGRNMLLRDDAEVWGWNMG